MGKRKEKYRGLFQSDSGVYFVRFRNGGRDTIKSTGKTDFDEAVEEYKKLRSDARLERTIDERFDDLLSQLRNIPDERIREETRQRLLSKLQGAANRKVLIADAWSEWRKGVKKTTEITIAGYEAVWKRFRLWLTEHRPSYEHLAQITPLDAKAYSQDLWGERITVTTYKLHLSWLSRLWRSLKMEAGLVENVWTEFLSEKMDKEQISREALTPDQLVTVIKSARGELRDLLLLGLYSGLRLKDACLLNRSQFDEAAGVISLIPFKTRRKGEKARVQIPVHRELLSLLRNPSPTGDYFPELAAKYRSQPQDVSQAVQDHFAKCGLKSAAPMSEDVRRKRAPTTYGYHSLRYSFVSAVAGQGVPQHVVGAIVGHSVPAMTLHYSKSNKAQRAAAVKSLPTLKALPTLNE